MSYQPPQDQGSSQWQQPAQYPPTQPYYQQPQPGYSYPPPVQVNVVQNAGGGRVPMKKGLNHLLHWTLTFFTGGLWLFVYIPLLLKRRKIVYR